MNGREPLRDHVAFALSDMRRRRQWREVAGRLGSPRGARWRLPAAAAGLALAAVTVVVSVTGMPVSGSWPR